MSLYRINPKRDTNERAIIQALQGHGFAVERVSGAGVPDLLVSRDGRVWFVEVKTPKGRLTPAQVAWRARWKGPTPHVIRTVDEAIAWCRSGDRAVWRPEAA